MSLPCSAVRKGAWSEAEDILLKNCIQKYGEGKWHQVPLKAGLNRCRKSCRLRWLNYLRPNIKRGKFTQDEVDLIIRLHKLLGNRWSLIAGRIPGRTANDVKNYWNTQHKNKNSSSTPDIPNARSNKTMQKLVTTTNTATTTTSAIIKPQPRTFSKNSHWVAHNHNINSRCAPSPHLILSPLVPNGDGTEYWDPLFDKNIEIFHGQDAVAESENEIEMISKHRANQIFDSDDENSERRQNDWCDEMLIDMDVWDVLNFDRPLVS